VHNIACLLLCLHVQASTNCTVDGANNTDAFDVYDVDHCSSDFPVILIGANNKVRTVSLAVPCGRVPKY
jgi:hypothetical protein